jgi:hypothetical protein
MPWTSRFLEPDVMPFLIPIAGILLGAIAVIVGGVVKILKMLIIHRERMAKIAHGMDPDYPPPADAGPP